MRLERLFYWKWKIGRSEKNIFEVTCWLLQAKTCSLHPSGQQLGCRLAPSWWPWSLTWKRWFALSELFINGVAMEIELDRWISAVMQSLFHSVAVKEGGKAKLSIYWSIYIPTVTYILGFGALTRKTIFQRQGLKLISSAGWQRAPSETRKRGHPGGDAFPHPEKPAEWLESCLEYPGATSPGRSSGHVPPGGGSVEDPENTCGTFSLSRQMKILGFSH